MTVTLTANRLSFAPVQQFQTIAFIDRSVPDYEQLAAGVVPNTEVILLDGDRDGIEQITQALAARPHLTSIHLVSHGAPGKVWLGNAELSLETLDRYGWQLQSWADPWATTPELLIYGCEVAQGNRGQSFVQRLSELTGMAIAASATRTGSAEQGGDWELEAQTGAIAVNLAFAPAAFSQYAATLSSDPLQYNINLATDNSNPSNFIDVNGTLYFSATNSSNGTELWKIDPTTGTPVRVTDFNTTDDLLVVSQTEFGLSQSSGVLDAAAFRLGTSATQAGDRFIYDFRTGNLFFDADGAGGAAQAQIARLTNRAALSSANIQVVA